MRKLSLHEIQLFLISDYWGKAQPIIRAAIPGLAVLGSVRKQTEQARRSKPVSSTPSWPLHQLLLVPASFEFLS